MRGDSTNGAQLSQRLASLDALRGFDMLWIMGGDELFHEWAKISGNNGIRLMSEQLDHAPWNGFTAYDLIFPLFLFIAGVATPYSVAHELAKGHSREQILLRVIRRGFLLVLLGIIYNNGLAFNPLEKIRFASVLGRIGLAYMFANILYLYCKKTVQILWCVGLLLGYWLLLRWNAAPGFSAGDLSMEGNFASYIDRMLLPGSLYLVIHDPEGLLSTLPAIGTGLMGILTGDLLKNGTISPNKKAINMGIAGIGCILMAQIWGMVFPLNKNLWTSSFALQAAGISLLLLTVFYYLIDIRGYTRWAFVFRIIGLNSILIYMSGVFIDWGYTAKALLGWLSQWSGPPMDVVVGILCIMVVKWAFLYFLYRKKIFLKV